MQTPAGRKAVLVIHKEHQQLSMVITGMQRLVKLLGAGVDVPRPVMFRSMLFYISEYPERLHHPKEERYLFARLRHRANDLDKTIDELEEQHVQGKARMRDIEHEFTRYELSGESALPVLREMVEDYAAFSANHRRLEEEVILPAARQWLTEEDWKELDEAFGSNRDPFGGVTVEADFGRLFATIVRVIKEP
ncbi:hemerythrin domain-containing protein (plasmid) [Cupriavidus sp. KK10]|jgi:hemerythrin-like domain-containing protein|uniref:hemerythrin domain-containing protein n=1 Tax=Cupriavidus sp. KK10 TaxID=1478019 RepID=UPI001BAD76C3|nr:hemerythrin domain-containing protein [Cupriavidus sp. KK10]QUN32123.1 hemerythrin domain-containing protein [Cupriavidus sp. KK10]